MRLLKSTIAGSFPLLATYWRAFHLLTKKNSYLHTTGYMTSLGNLRPIDREGEALPFLNYALISILKDRIEAGSRVFEYGSGYSTFFFGRLNCHVTSVEDNESWAEFVKEKSKGYPQCELRLRPLGRPYVDAIQEDSEKYDLVLIDGRRRIECAAAALCNLSDKGVILWDDSSRERYAPGLQALKNAGFKILRIQGLKPAGFGTDETAICYRPDNCLKL